LSSNVYFFSILLGLVQGISEWLPISSKTQVLFASTALFGLPIAAAYALGLFLEIGSLGTASVYFRKDIVSLFHDRRLFIFLLVVTIFTGLVGAPLLYITELYLTHASPYIGLPMIVLGLALIGIGFYIRFSRALPRINTLAQMKMKHYIIIGIAQGIAALPGVSRSGMTVSTMLFMGVKQDQAFRLSYLAYLPASLGAFCASIILERHQINTDVSSTTSLGLFLAIISAFLIGLVTISYLLKFAKSKNVWILDIVIGMIALVLGIIFSIYFYVLPSGANVS
jgi:undecaprenyl-diphosphatase